jgi:sorbitol-specific phosphotransferase system component IIC
MCDFYYEMGDFYYENGVFGVFSLCKIVGLGLKNDQKMPFSLHFSHFLYEKHPKTFIFHLHYMKNHPLTSIFPSANPDSHSFAGSGVRAAGTRAAAVDQRRIFCLGRGAFLGFGFLADFG